MPNNKKQTGIKSDLPKEPSSAERQELQRNQESVSDNNVAQPSKERAKLNFDHWLAVLNLAVTAIVGIGIALLMNHRDQQFQIIGIAERS